jgi:hypothetical protein
MRTEAHIEKFKRFNRVRARLNPHADFELWYWMTLNAGTAIITRAHDSFATQIPNIYSVAGPDGTRHMEYVFGVDIIHVGMPKIERPLPPTIADAFSAMEIIEEFRDPCVREDRPITDQVIRACCEAYARCLAAAKSCVEA